MRAKRDLNGFVLWWCYACSIDATADVPNWSGFGRLINHSRSRPNLKPVVIVDTLNVPHIVLYSGKKDIEAGSELLFDYGDRDKTSLQYFPWLKE